MRLERTLEIERESAALGSGRRNGFKMFLMVYCRTIDAKDNIHNNKLRRKTLSSLLLCACFLEGSIAANEPNGTRLERTLEIECESAAPGSGRRDVLKMLADGILQNS